MTDTSPIQSSYSAGAIASTASMPSSSETNASTVSSDFETFLKMMTVQIQNQDPLSPMDPSDYSTQLATFSSVEQQVLTNDLLKQLGSLLGGGAMEQYGSWVGMDALARVPTEFVGEPVKIRPDVAAGADTARLVVRDQDGNIVETFSLPVNQEEAIWTGLDPDGEAYPSGSYRFEVESYKNQSLIETRMASTYNQVEEIRSNGDSVVIRLSGGIEVDAAFVQGLRAA